MENNIDKPVVKPSATASEEVTQATAPAPQNTADPEQSTTAAVENTTPKANSTIYGWVKFTLYFAMLVAAICGINYLEINNPFSNSNENQSSSAIAPSLSVVVANAKRLRQDFQSQGLSEDETVVAIRELIYVMNDMDYVVLDSNMVVGATPSWAETPAISGELLLKISKIRVEYRNKGKPMPTGSELIKLAEAQ